MPRRLVLELLPKTFAVCQLSPSAAVPEWARGEFVSITRTSQELSVVCMQAFVPPGIACERDWRILRVRGPLDFALTGILASITAPLADAGIPVFALSTFSTDYVLVKEAALDKAISTLEAAGHAIHYSTPPPG